MLTETLWNGTNVKLWLLTLAQSLILSPLLYKMKTQHCKKNNYFILYPHHQGLSHPFLGKEIHLLLLHLKTKEQNNINRWALPTLMYTNACVPGIHTVCKHKQIYTWGMDQGAGSLSWRVFRGTNVCLLHSCKQKNNRRTFVQALPLDTKAC